MISKRKSTFLDVRLARLMYESMSPVISLIFKGWKMTQGLAHQQELDHQQELLSKSEFDRWYKENAFNESLFETDSPRAAYFRYCGLPLGSTLTD